MRIIIISVLVFSFTISRAQEMYQEFHENGSLKFEVPLLDGKKEGMGKTYFADGTLKIEAEYKNDKLNGKLVQHYYGRIVKEVYYQDDVLNGYAVYYNPAKRITKEGNYVNGKMNGVWKEYAEDGWLFYENTYVNDEKKGPYTRYQENGQIEQTGHWLNGMLDGEHVYYEAGKAYRWAFFKTRNDSLFSLLGPSFLEAQDPSFQIKKDGKGDYFYVVKGTRKKLIWTF